MLAVRRAGVTVALNYLESRGLISLARKQIVITDRNGLKAAANGTYHQSLRRVSGSHLASATMQLGVSKRGGPATVLLQKSLKC